MFFETADKSSNITVTTDNMTTTDKQVSEGVVELEMETESIFKVPTKREKNLPEKDDKQNKKQKIKLKV